MSDIEPMSDNDENYEEEMAADEYGGDGGGESDSDAEEADEDELPDEDVELNQMRSRAQETDMVEIYYEDDDEDVVAGVDEVDDPAEESDDSFQLSDSVQPPFKENDEADTVVVTDENFISKQEELKLIYLRSFLNKVDKFYQEKDANSRKLQEEVKNCKERIQNLEKKRDDTYGEIEKAQENENITMLNRLAAEHSNQCHEIELENEVLTKLIEALEKADYERNKALLEKTKYALTEHDLENKEKILIKQKEYRAMVRKADEDKKIFSLKKRLQRQKQIETAKFREQEIRDRNTMEQAKQARQVATQYLQKTLREMKEKKEVHELRAQGETDKKRKSLLQLKQTIDHNKEVLQAKVNKKNFNDKKKLEALNTEKSVILGRGENPDFYIPRRQKMEDFIVTKKKFQERQQRNTEVIVRKILQEEKNLEKKRELYPELYNITRKIKFPQEKNKKSFKELKRIAETLGYNESELELFEDDTENENNLQKELDKIETHSLFDSTTIASKDDDDSDYDELNKEEEVLAKPEFEGLWNAKFTKYDADDLYNKKQKFPTCFKTKMEQDIYLQTLEKLKKSAVREQVVAGRKFNGVSFKSQPREIHFKDFDVGQTYKIKIVLTNISYSINTCKLVGITEKLKDFITIDFQPPGQLSAGLNCEFTVTFEPKINEDLKGEVTFLATNGPFSIPISCTIKKCDLSVTSQVVGFGTTVIGETLNRKIQLHNKGALGTRYQILSKKSRNAPSSASGLIQSAVMSSSTQGFQDAYQSSANDLIQNSTSKGLNSKLLNDDLTSNVSYRTGGENLKEEPKPQSEIALISIKEGILEPFSNVDVEFTFSPVFPGKFHDEFVVFFEDKDSKEIDLLVKGSAIDVPIWIDKTNIDLKICMYDRLYQEVIRVHNRSSAALRITFDIPEQLKNHMEILPKTAFIQAKAEFSAQLKFIARQSLAKDTAELFDAETGVLEVPLHIKVADQKKVVNYNMHAIVTTSDLEFDMTDINFGCCTIYETARATVKLTNKSILCQPFGFVKLPEFVQVQPNDGFGTLLPNETITLDVNFSPKSAKEYKFQVVCKSLVNRDFVINCQGVGVHPPMKLSSQRVHFKATALNDTSYVDFYVINDHLDYDEHRHPVPRIGNGSIPNVSATAFEFDLPENCPFTLSPMVGVVQPGQQQKITLKYTAKLDEQMIKEEAARIMKRSQLEQQNKRRLQDQMSVHESVAETEGGKSKKKGQGGQKKNSEKAGSHDSARTDYTTRLLTPDANNISVSSAEYSTGQASLFYQYEGDVKTFQIACYIASNAENLDKIERIDYEPANTLYLDVVCPSIKPELVVISNDSSTNIDFGSISLGHRSVKTITVQNISDSMLNLTSNDLDPHGPFQLLNSLRPLEMGATLRLIVAFSPTKGSIFQEYLRIKSGGSSLNLRLNGIGIQPSVSLSLEGNSLDFGYSLAGERIERVIQMQNNSKLPIEYKITLDSANPILVKESEAKRCLHFSDLSYRPTIGPNNYAGSSSFDVVPIEGLIASGAKKDLTLIFSPDHQSELFADVMRISLSSGDESARTIQLLGKCRNHTMYIKGTDLLSNNSNTESLLVTDLESIDTSAAVVPAGAPPPAAAAGEDTSLKVPIPILVTLYSIASSKNSNEFTTAEKTITIGCMKTNPNSKKEMKKNGDFTFENTKDINVKGFNVDLTKSAVESGGERQVKITWKPVAGSDVTQTVQSSILVTTKGDATEQWRLILKGRVISDEDSNAKRMNLGIEKMGKLTSSSSQFLKSSIAKEK